MELREIGMHIKNQRSGLGVSQSQLAKLAGLSRTTINHLESGSLDDLGLSLDAKPRLKKWPALEMAAQSASTSYTKRLTATLLQEILGSGVAPDDFKPHIMTLLEETSVALLVSAIQEASIATHTSTKLLF